VPTNVCQYQETRGWPLRKVDDNDRNQTQNKTQANNKEEDQTKETSETETKTKTKRVFFHVTAANTERITNATTDYSCDFTLPRSHRLTTVS
jgi:hypothetical protein